MMRIFNFRRLATVLLLFIVAAMQAQMQMPPIPMDKDVRMGKLDNGLTYYIRYNNWPENRANFYIAQKVGSMQEEESQRGLAHFLEHMAFNGSENYPDDKLLRYCESIGVKFGTDLNAYTSLCETVYNIDNVPTANVNALDSCLLILRDWSCGLLLKEEEIDKERGVIHEEWRGRSNASMRMYERAMPILYPGCRYGVRFPIGLMEVVDNFKYDELRNYYHKWYHPKNQGIIVIGDIDVDRTEAKIKEMFGSIKTPENAALAEYDAVPDTDEPIVVIEKDKEQPKSQINLMFKHDVFPQEMKQNMVYYVMDYAKSAAFNMLNNRLHEMTLNPECPFTGASAEDGAYIFAKTKDAFSVGVLPKEAHLGDEALKAAFIEVRRAAENGFTETEYERFKQNFLSGLEKSYESRDKRSNTHFFEQCKDNFLDGEPMPDIEFTYNTMKQLANSIPLEAINQMMKEMMPTEFTKNVAILSLNREADDVVPSTREELLQAVADARAAKVEAYVDNVKNEPIIAKLPKAGKIKKEVKSDKFDYTTLTLSNGAKVILKKTDHKKDQVLLSGYAMGGSTLYGEKDWVNCDVFNNVVGLSGLGNFSSQELTKALAGKIAGAGLSLSGSSTGVSGNSTPKDVETMLQLIYLYFTNISKDQQMFDKFISNSELALKNRNLSPETAFSDSTTATLYGHDRRLEPMTVEKLKLIDYDRILQIAKERTNNASVWTFTIMGNFDEETIRPLICQYLAALPSTKAKADKPVRTTKMVEGVVDNIFTRKMETPQTNSVMVWYNEEIPYTLKNSICCNVAGQVLSMIYLKKIREEASAAYSCGAQGKASISELYHTATIQAYCPMKPEMKDVALGIMRDEVENLAKTCDADMLTKVKEYLLKSYPNSIKTNQYWMGVISMYERFGIDSHSDYESIVNSLTPETICEYMREFLKSGNRITVAMFPAE